jgi:hypothetical protein
MIDTVLFDLGNTLVRYYGRREFPAVLERSLAAVSDSLGKSLDGIREPSGGRGSRDSRWPHASTGGTPCADLFNRSTGSGAARKRRALLHGPYFRDGCGL